MTNDAETETSATTINISLQTVASIIEGNALQTVPPGPDLNTVLIQLLAQIQVANRALLSNIGMPEPNKLDNSVCPFYIA